ncbi:hypothetical protein ABIB25_004554 [Nakamurella sp. UYEF19]|uniref:peptidoglycan-binding domain-containing protein n=1 Tax=Nakamurella sp. UYEF19 TaxID=1756392 RepID=UPI0033988A72
MDSQFCPHCGTRTISSGEPVWTGASRQAYADAELPTIPSLPAVPRSDGPLRATPEMFPTEMVPTAGAGASQAWSQAPEPGAAPIGPQTGLFPGWTGMYPVVATEGAGGALAPRPVRRRKAIYAVLAIAAATVIVLVAAILIAPHLGGAGNVADKDGQPTAVASSPSVSAPNSVAPAPAPNDGATSGPPSSVVPVTPTPARTVTVTQAPTRTVATKPGAGTARTTLPRTTPPKATPTPTPPKTTTPPKTAPKTTAPPTPTTPAVVLGVPQKNITCNAGYIVQLASEFDAATFAAHVARLKAAGQVPTGALAADSAGSCKIFTSQTNTLVLYAGPFSSPYAGCAARLSGPADAYIKGSNPDTSGQYVSCLCPTSINALPQYSAVGQQGVWIGEVQRVLGNRLNFNVSDLSGNWGTFTAGTKAAVLRFQQSVKLPANGVLDGRTWQAIQRAEC